MFTNGFCYTGAWGSSGYYGIWNSTGWILNLVFWAGLLAGLTVLVILAIRRARVPSSASSYANRQLSAKEILQAQYARGEIGREQYEQMKQELR